MKTFWFKEILTNPVIISGRPVEWIPLDGNQGILELDSERDGPLIAGLDEFAQQHRGGVVRINESDFAQKKMDFPLRTSSRKSTPDALRLAPMGPLHKPKPEAAAVPVDTAARPPGASGNAPVPGNPLGAPPPNPFPSAVSPETMATAPAGGPVPAEPDKGAPLGPPPFKPRIGKASAQPEPVST